MTLRQWLWLSLLAFFWGSAFIFMELALPVFSPLVIVASRMTVAALLLNLIVWQRKTASRLEKAVPLFTWIQCGGLSLLSNLIPFGLVVWGQQYISASLASILIAAAPVFTVLLTVVWKKERLTLSRALGVSLGFAGVVVLVGPTVLRGFSLKGAGELAILGAALSYAIAGFAGQRFNYLPPLLVSRMTVTMGALMIVPIALVFAPTGIVIEALKAGSASTALLAMAGLGIFSTGLAYVIFYRLLAQVGVVNTSLVSFLVPMSAVVLSVVVLGERVGAQELLGMGCILCGLAVLDGRLARRLVKRID